MKNPFKFGAIVDGHYFTDRQQEQKDILNHLNGPNHLILISPRRFGKTSLIHKVLKAIDRPSIYLNLQKVIDTTDLASLLIREVFKLYPLEKLKSLVTSLRIVPTVSINPMTNGIDVSFHPQSDPNAVLEDAFDLIQRVTDPECPLIVVFDEFQEIVGMEKGLDKRLRAILQEQNDINYIFLGSQESMMTEIFERVKSPFYHFGLLMHLKRIPAKDFLDYIVNGLSMLEKAEALKVAQAIIEVTDCHPYYTQQLSSQVWEALQYGKCDESEDVVLWSVNNLVRIHDLDFERMWLNFNRTDRRILQSLAKQQSIVGLAQSTAYSSVSRLMKNGFVIKTPELKIEDPFFGRWILEKQI